MQEYTTISVKISVKEREEMKRLNISPSELMRKAIMNRLKKERLKKLWTKRDKLNALFEKLSTEEVTASIREDRELR